MTTTSTSSTSSTGFTPKAVRSSRTDTRYTDFLKSGHADVTSKVTDLRAQQLVLEKQINDLEYVAHEIKQALWRLSVDV